MATDVSTECLPWEGEGRWEEGSGWEGRGARERERGGKAKGQLTARVTEKENRGKRGVERGPCHSGRAWPRTPRLLRRTARELCEKGDGPDTPTPTPTAPRTAPCSGVAASGSHTEDMAQFSEGVGPKAKASGSRVPPGKAWPGQEVRHSWVVLAAEIKQHCPDRLEHLGCSRTEGAVIRNLEGIPTLGD
ncbi:hypothetical protein JZ751_028452 [Albula glossodonta]|uniref:Uncharacterized protein n=1 Tax=Albula glossodonta TaxID=121402 RepID=A0A8T2NE49_9TELE|nr:hypothetical protein JZ751_028452 [Albula glossodonta]